MVPKLLPCLHKICRDCFIATINEQKKRGDYHESEREIYCSRCEKYIHLPEGNVDDIPTVYEYVREDFDNTICSIDQCFERGFSYCYQCDSVYCSQHTKEHYFQNNTHSLEIFFDGKFCIEHEIKKEYYCCQCNEIICSKCFSEKHSDHIVCNYRHFLSKYYTSDSFNIYKRLSNLSSIVRRAGAVHDNLYFYNKSSVDEQIQQISDKLDGILSKYSTQLTTSNGVDINKISKELAEKFKIQSTVCPSQSTIEAPNKIVVQQKTTVDVTVRLNDIYGKPTMTTDINVTLTPISHVLPGCVDYFEEINHDICDDGQGNGGEATATISNYGNGRITITIKGEKTGDMLLRVYVNKIEIEKSPLTIHKSNCLITSVSTLDDGSYVVTDTENHNMKIFKTDSVYVVGGFGKNSGEFNFPIGVATAFIKGKNVIAVVDSINCNIQLFTAEGKHIKTLGRSGPYLKGCLDSPLAVAISSTNEIIFVADTGHGVIQGFPFVGQPYIVIGKNDIENGITPVSIDVIEEEGNIYIFIVDKTQHRIIRFDTTTKKYITKGLFNFKHRRGHFSFPISVSIDRKRKQIYVVDDGNRIQLFDINLVFISMYRLENYKIKFNHFSNSLDKLIIGFGIDNLIEFKRDSLESYSV
ncbi:Nhl repeat-containing protein [Entamoeba marina]